MTDEKKEEVTEEVTEVKPKGFSLLVNNDGVISLTPHNLQSDFELAGMIDYASTKKTELLKSIGKSPEVRTLQAVKGLTDILERVFSTAQEQVTAGATKVKS
jgi:hypothetical protein